MKINAIFNNCLSQYNKNTKSASKINFKASSPYESLNIQENSDSFKKSDDFDVFMKQLKDKTSAKKNIDFYKKKDYHLGLIPAHWLNAEGLRKMNQELGLYPKTLAEIYTTPNEKGALPAHVFCLDEGEQQLIAMNEGLKNQPEVLEDIYTTPDCDGNILAHQFAYNRFKGIGCRQFAVMNNLFKDKPDFLRKIYTDKNNDGKTPLYIVAKCNPDKTSIFKSVYETLKDRPDILEEIFTPIAKLED